jgi:hypothetical protein
VKKSVFARLAKQIIYLYTIPVILFPGSLTKICICNTGRKKKRIILAVCESRASPCIKLFEHTLPEDIAIIFDLVTSTYPPLERVRGFFEGLFGKIPVYGLLP